MTVMAMCSGAAGVRGGAGSSPSGARPGQLHDRYEQGDPEEAAGHHEGGECGRGGDDARLVRGVGVDAQDDGTRAGQSDRPAELPERLPYDGRVGPLHGGDAAHHRGAQCRNRQTHPEPRQDHPGHLPGVLEAGQREVQATAPSAASARPSTAGTRTDRKRSSRYPDRKVPTARAVTSGSRQRPVSRSERARRRSGRASPGHRRSPWRRRRSACGVAGVPAAVGAPTSGGRLGRDIGLLTNGKSVGHDPAAERRSPREPEVTETVHGYANGPVGLAAGPIPSTSTPIRPTSTTLQDLDVVAEGPAL